MSKAKSPILSLGARGTIGDALTYQKRGQDTIVRQKPIPAYRRTLAQVYQRWLYEDYAYWWTQQTEPTKRQYAADGARFHLTGFQYWMKVKLNTLPDIAGMWHLDYISGSATPDASRNANHGTVFGAIITNGIIDKALAFDGIDDYVNVPHNAILDPISALSLELLFKQTDTTLTWRSVLGKGTMWGKGYHIVAQDTLTLYCRVDTLAGSKIRSFSYSLNTWYHIIMVFTGTSLQVFADGIAQPKLTFASTTLDPADTIPFRIASRQDFGGSLFPGIIDQVIVYNRALDATEAKRHSERRYP